MKIAISTTGETLASELDPKFGRAQYFIVYDIEQEKISAVINNTLNVNAQGGAGTNASQLIANSGATAVISGNFGPNAFKGLNAFDIEIYSSEVQTIKEVINNFKAGKLTKVSSATVPGQH